MADLSVSQLMAPFNPRGCHLPQISRQNGSNCASSSKILIRCKLLMYKILCSDIIPLSNFYFYFLFLFIFGGGGLSSFYVQGGALW